MLEKLSGIGPKTIENLRKINITNLDNLISYYPFRYEILTRTSLESEKAIVDGVVISEPTVYYFNFRKNLLKFKFDFDGKIISVDIYNRAFLKPKLIKGAKITLIGKYEEFKNTLVASELMFGMIPPKKIITPIYHQTAALSNKKINSLIRNAFFYHKPTTYIPMPLIEKYQFLPVSEALKEIHFPTDQKKLQKAIYRQKYEELFLFMLKINYLKLNKKKNGLTRNVNFKQIEDFIKKIPFSLTNDQLKAINDIFGDLNNSKRMNRLLQGDVGSGKTIVALVALYINYLSGYQGVLMVPTEVLANQHFETLNNLMPNLKIALLTSSIKKKQEIKKKLNEHQIDIIIGTHALLTDDVLFGNLGLVITDEQHRFGVNQRKNLMNKGTTPDILYMSATPIPRTYALTIYGDMDISIIKEQPSGRKKIITYVRKMNLLKDVLAAMLEELKKGHQIYVIAPLIEESEKTDMESVMQVFQNMEKAFSKKFKVGLLHGKIKNDEKETIINEFKKNNINILVSTTVIEVGIDNPNATMMVVYDSHMFGLSTLHQLRGRVGRSDLQSYCVFLSNQNSERLKILEKTNDGFLISEEDFKLRGSGDLFGSMQSGDMKFKIANLKEDFDLLLLAKKDSLQYIDEVRLNEIFNELEKLA